jgi:hypothetical protein
MASQDDEHELRRMAHAAMRAGILPNHRPERVWGGKGTGATCAVCARSIDAIELEFELDFETPDENECNCPLRVHARCFSVWDQELSAGRYRA